MGEEEKEIYNNGVQWGLNYSFKNWDGDFRIGTAEFPGHARYSAVSLRQRTHTHTHTRRRN